MSNNRGATMAKRARERALKERHQNKLARRAERRAAKRQRDDHPGGVDPDIAGIVPGPQPLPSDEPSNDEEV
jgi:hypothetical protein